MKHTLTKLQLHATAERNHIKEGIRLAMENESLHFLIGWVASYYDISGSELDALRPKQEEKNHEN